MALDKQAILDQITQLQASGLPKEEIVRKIVDRIRLERTPPDAGPSSAADNLPSILNPPTPAGPPPAPSGPPSGPDVNALAAIPGAAGAPQPTPQQPSMSPAVAPAGTSMLGTPGTTIGPRPLRLDERMDDWGKAIGDEVIRASGFDPANLAQHPEAIFLAPASLMSQVALASLGGATGPSLLAKVPGLGPLAESVPWVGRLVDWLGLHGGAAAGLALPAGAAKAIETQSASQGIKESGEIMGGVLALDATLMGLGAGLKATGLPDLAAKTVWPAVREGVSTAVNHGFSWLDQWVKASAKPLTSSERTAIARFTGRTMADALQAKTDPAGVMQVLNAIRDVLPTVKPPGSSTPVMDAMHEEMAAALRGEPPSQVAADLQATVDKLKEGGKIPERRAGQIKAPPGTRTLQFMEDGSLKPGPLKNADLIWNDRGNLQTGQYVGQAPGPAGSTLLQLRQADGTERFFQVRDGESRVMFLPQAEGKEGRLAQLKASRERVAAKKAALPPPENPTVSELTAQQKADDGWRLLSGDEALDEMRADPQGKRLTAFNLPEPQGGSGPVTSLGQVKEDARPLGLEVKATELTGADGKPTTSFRVTRDGQELFNAASLTDAAAEIKRYANSNRQLALALEPLGELAFQDDPNDDPDTRRQKTVLRNMVRGASLGLLVAPSADRAFVSKLNGRMASFWEGLVDSGSKARARALWGDTKSTIANLYNSLRSPEELFRHDVHFGDVTKRTASAKRAEDFERNEFRNLLYTTADRAGLRPESIEARAAGQVVDAIDRDLLLKLPTTGNVRDAWTAAIDQSAASVTPERTAAAKAALDNLSPHQLQVTQRVVQDVFQSLRQRATDVFMQTFEREEGAMKPFAVLDQVLRDDKGKPTGRLINGRGEFVDRFASQQEADAFIQAKADRIRQNLPPDGLLQMPDGSEVPVLKATPAQLSGLATVQSRAPLPAEVEARMGRNLSAYLPHLFFDEGMAGYNMDEMLAAFPQMAPGRIVDELDRLSQVSGARPYIKDGVEHKTTRSAFESVFGQLGDDEFKQLLDTGLRARALGHAAAEEQVFERIPRRMYVRFYKERLDKGGFDTDLIKAASAYTNAVLRDIHYTPILPDLRRALSGAVASDANPGLVREFKYYMDDTLRRQPAFDPGLARATGKLAALAYNGILLGRSGPAFNNLIGQMLLVGLPEMGFDSASSALALTFDPELNKVLADVPFIKHALPLGETGIQEAWKRLRDESFTSWEKMTAAKDVAKSAVNFMAQSEYAIRKWAFMGGIIEQAKKEGLISPNRVLDWARKDALPGVKAFVEKWDHMPVEQAARHHRNGEDMVRRVAFFFESSNMPRAYRFLRNKLPGGQAFLQFTNFPTNYMNRFVTIARDAFDKSLPVAERRANQGKIMRHLFMTLMIAGPAGLPVINELTQNASTLDNSVGARLKRLIQPLQSYWSQFQLDRDMSRFSTLSPITDLLQPNRFMTAPIPRMAGNLAMSVGSRPLEEMFGMDPTVGEYTREARQKAFGMLSPYFGVPPPDNRFLPEFVSTLMPMGYSIEDMLRLSAAYDKAGKGQGPLDPYPAARLVTGAQSVEERSSRLDQKAVSRDLEMSRLIRQDFLRALTDPDLPERLRRRAYRTMNARPDLLSTFDSEDVRGMIGKKGTIPVERQIAVMQPLEALRLQQRITEQLRDAEHLSPHEREYLARVLRATVLRASH